MRKWSSITLLLIILLGSSVLAQQGSPVKISGANSGKLDLNQQIFYAEGKVELEFDQARLRGDQLVWDLQSQRLEINGNVVFEQHNNIFRGDSLIYNVETSQGEFFEARTELTADNVEGPIFIFGETVKINGSDYHISQGGISSCDLTDPHYHLAVKDIEVYPGNKLVIRGVTYYEGRIPLFYWPYLALPLDGRFDNLDFILPEIGYSVRDGYYIKNRYNYYLSENAYGTILYDYYTRRGLGLGIDHNYQNSVIGEGEIGLYGLPFADDQQFVAQLNHKYHAEDFNLTTRNSYVRELNNSGAVVHDNNSSTRISYQRDNLEIGGNFNYSDKQEAQQAKQLSWSLAGNFRHRITPNFLVNARSSISTKNKDQTLDNLLETQYSYGDHRFLLGIQQRYNPDILDDDKTPTWKSVNRLPELTWQWNNPSLKNYKLNGRFELSAGRFAEYPLGVNSARLIPRIELFTRSWRSDFGTTITYSGGGAGYFYQDGLNQQVLHGRMNLSQQLGDGLRLTATYNKRSVWGETPFNFDQQAPQDSLTANLRYSVQHFTLSVRSGYNFRTDRFSALIPQINFNNRQGMTGSLSVNYDLNNKKIGRMTGRFSYNPDPNFNFRIGTSYHIGNQTLEIIDGSLAFDLTDTIKLSYDLVYEPTKTRMLTKGEIKLTFDLHCRELLVSYNQVRQDFRVQYSLNAFPKLPVEVSTAEGISFFELSDIQDLLGLN